jgi:hypothetical protein
MGKAPILDGALKGAPDLVARGLFVARDLQVSRPSADSVAQPATEPVGHALTRWQPGVGLGERPLAARAAEAALAPPQDGSSPPDR